MFVNDKKYKTKWKIVKLFIFCSALVNKTWHVLISSMNSWQVETDGDRILSSCTLVSNLYNMCDHKQLLIIAHLAFVLHGSYDASEAPHAV